MTKQCGTPELLIRIDERVKTLFNNIPILKQDIRDIKISIQKIELELSEHKFALSNHHNRIKAVENTAIGFNIARLFKFIK